MKSFVVLFAILFSCVTFGKEIHLLKFTNDVNENLGRIYAGLNEGNNDIVYLRYVLLDMKKGKVVADEKFGRKQLLDGTVVKGKFRKGMNIYSSNFEYHNGGHIVITVAKNIFKKSEKVNFTFELERLGDEWRMNYSRKDGITHIEFLMNKVWGVPVGVEGLRVVR